MSPTLKGYAIFILLFMIVRGTSFFELPSDVTRAFGTNSWIVLGIYTILIIFQIWLMSIGTRKHHNQSIFQLIENHLPRWLAVTILMILTVFYVCISFQIAYSFIRVLQFTNDPTINVSKVTLIMLVVVAVIAWHGMYTMTKSTVLFFCLTIWITLLGFLQFKDFSLTRLSPFLLQGGTWSLESMLDVYSAFHGYLIILYITPLFAKQMKWFKYAAFSLACTGLYYMLNCMLTQGLVPYEMLLHIHHVALRVNGASRITALVYITDLLFITFVFSCVITSSAYMWIAHQSAMQTSAAKKHPLITRGIILAAAISLPYLPLNYQYWNSFFRILIASSLILSVIFTLLYLIIPYKAGSKHEDASSPPSSDNSQLGSLPAYEGGSSRR